MTLMATFPPGQSTRRQLIMEIAHCRSGHIEHRGFAMNSINVIAPYKHHGMWVFDDPRVGLLPGAVRVRCRYHDRPGSGRPARCRARLYAGLFRHAVPRTPISPRLAARGGRRQLVLRRATEHGGLALPGAPALLLRAAERAVRADQVGFPQETQ